MAASRLARVDQIDLRFVARNEPPIRIGRRRGEGEDRGRVFEHAADVVEADSQIPAYCCPRTDSSRPSIYSVHVHARAVVAENRFRHQGDRLVVTRAIFLRMYLYFSRLSPILISESNRMSISAWPAVATS